MHVFQRDQREVTLKSTNTFHIIPQFHQSMFIFTTSANRPINMERSAEVFNEVLQLQKQETPDCAGLLAWYMSFHLLFFISYDLLQKKKKKKKLLKNNS